MAVVFLVASGSSIILQKTGVHEHITAIFIFAVFLTSILTDGYIYGIVSALVGTLAVNYAYTYPFYALDFRFQSNMISAVVMMAIAVLMTMLQNPLVQLNCWPESVLHCAIVLTVQIPVNFRAVVFLYRIWKFYTTPDRFSLKAGKSS